MEPLLTFIKYLENIYGRIPLQSPILQRLLELLNRLSQKLDILDSDNFSNPLYFKKRYHEIKIPHYFFNPPIYNVDESSKVQLNKLYKEFIADNKSITYENKYFVTLITAIPIYLAPLLNATLSQIDIFVQNHVSSNVRAASTQLLLSMSVSEASNNSQRPSPIPFTTELSYPVAIIYPIPVRPPQSDKSAQSPPPKRPENMLISLPPPAKRPPK